MIKFFRKIRQNLVTENKFSKYLFYAIGEVILVVIGILIALNINNQNEQTIKEEKLKSVYLEAQRELALNINRATLLIDFYEKKDSIIYLVLNDKLTKEDYINTPEMAFILFRNAQMYIQNKAYLSLTNKLDILPGRFSTVLKKLNIVYENNKSLTEMIQNQFNQSNSDFLKNLSDSKNWYLELINKQKLNDEILEYLVNDPFYKNKVFDYQSFYYNMSLPRLKKNAVNAYKALSDVTGKKDDIDTSIYFQPDEELSKYVGEFKINSNDARFNAEEGYNKINIKLTGSQLHCILFGDVKVDIFPHTENVFILGDSDNAKFTFLKNENDQITGFQLFNESVYTDWNMVK
jgi:hypothetical protein